jgi:ribosomal protein S18 acetylase RimI-like enzyme
MLEASRAHLRHGVWDLIIGADEIGCLDYLKRLVVAQPRSLCHFDNFLVAELDGRAVAALCGFEFRTNGWAGVAQAMATVQNHLGWTEVDLDESRARAAAIWNCLLPDAGADWGIENVATLPEFRRSGLATELVNSALCEGRARGMRLAQIVTFIGNDAALAVYRKCGFRVADEKRCDGVEAALGVPGFVRLLREI